MATNIGICIYVIVVTSVCTQGMPSESLMEQTEEGVTMITTKKPTNEVMFAMFTLIASATECYQQFKENYAAVHDVIRHGEQYPEGGNCFIHCINDKLGFMSNLNIGTKIQEGTQRMMTGLVSRAPDHLQSPLRENIDHCATLTNSSSDICFNLVSFGQCLYKSSLETLVKHGKKTKET